MKSLCFIFAFYCTCSECFGIKNYSTFLNELYQSSNRDSIPGKRALGTLKINPFQILFSEIPVSFEVYRLQRSSLQIQIGYIFPARNSIREKFFESWGTEGTAKSDGLLSYRKSPFNNDGGINFKIEFRKYKHLLDNEWNKRYRSTYFAPQLMYKYSYYHNLTFTKKDGTGSDDFTYYQRESKNSHVFGFGLMFGYQTCHGRFVTNWYGGAGLRLRSINARILEISEYWDRPGYPIYPNTIESKVSFYPYVNAGFIMGFEL